MKKDAFSGPRYLLAAAKQAAGVAEGKDFSPWVVAAIREKLERDLPQLIERMRAEMQVAAMRDYDVLDPLAQIAAETPTPYQSNNDALPIEQDLGGDAVRRTLEKMEQAPKKKRKGGGR